MNVLSSMFPNFATLETALEDEATVDARVNCIDMLPVPGMVQECIQHTMAWAFSLLILNAVGNAKAWKRGISSKYSSHAFLFYAFV